MERKELKALIMAQFLSASYIVLESCLIDFDKETLEKADDGGVFKSAERSADAILDYLGIE